MSYAGVSLINNAMKSLYAVHWEAVPILEAASSFIHHLPTKYEEEHRKELAKTMRITAMALKAYVDVYLKELDLFIDEFEKGGR